MKICRNLIQLITLVASLAMASAQTETTDAQLIRLNLDPAKVTTVYLHTGYITSIRLPEPVSSVVLGDPGTFKAEHSEAEPQLVFFKPATAQARQTNALITTRAGREIALTLVNQAAGKRIDYLVQYEPPRSFLIQASHPTFLVEDTKTIDQGAISKEAKLSGENRQSELLIEQSKTAPQWEGKSLRVGIGRSFERGNQTTVAFSVLNASERAIELLSPQVRLAGTTEDRHGRSLKAEPVPIETYRLSTRTLGPGERAEGLVVFERPAFKESRERLVLQIAQSDQVDRPVLLAIPFVPTTKGDSK
jgi:hypothetical protein